LGEKEAAKATKGKLEGIECRSKLVALSWPITHSPTISGIFFIGSTQARHLKAPRLATTKP
jgi:hypothetical protein